MHVGTYKTGIFYHKINMSASNLLFIVILIWVMMTESQVSESVWMKNNKAKGWRNPLWGKIRFAGTNKCGSLTGSCQMCCQHPPPTDNMWQEGPEVSIYCTSTHVFLLEARFTTSNQQGNLRPQKRRNWRRRVHWCSALHVNGIQIGNECFSILHADAGNIKWLCDITGAHHVSSFILHHKEAPLKGQSDASGTTESWLSLPSVQSTSEHAFHAPAHCILNACGSQTTPAYLRWSLAKLVFHSST